MSVLWNIGNRFNAINSSHSSGSSDGALYEYIKNLEEAKANKVYVDMDYLRRRICISGNSVPVDATEMNRILSSTFSSIKDDKHWGSGLLSFIRICHRMIFISKKGDYFYIVTCAADPGGKDYCSDIGDPRRMTTPEMVEYADATGRLRSLGQGSSYVLERVGTGPSDKVPVNFKMSDEFTGEKFTKWMQERYSYLLKKISVMLKTGKDAPERIESKLGKGHHLKFKLPSKEYPGAPNASFEMGGHPYNLSVEFDLYISTSHNGEIQICEEHYNSLPMNEAIGMSTKVHRTSIFRNHSLSRYLIGMVNFKISTSSNDAPPLNLYSGARDKLLVDNSFGDALSRLLTYAEVDIVKPEVIKYEERIDGRQDQVRTTRLNKGLHDFFKKYQGDFGWLQKSTSPVRERTVTCPSCKEIGRVVILGSKRPNISKIQGIVMLIGNTYSCGNCNSEWDKKEYEARTYEVNPDDKPVYKAPDHTDLGKEREREHGYGYDAAVVAFGREDTREFRLQSNRIEINSRHPVYQQIQKTRKPHFITYHEYRLALSAILSQNLKTLTTEEAIKGMNSAYSTMEKWFFSEKSIEREEDGPAKKLGV
jgi:hypothetical protein